MKGFRKAVALCAALLAACGGDSVQSPDFTPELLEINITPSETTTVEIGATQQFAAVGVFTTQPGSSSDTQLMPITPSWSVDDASVATISSSGLLTAVEDGSTVVTASQDGVSASVEVIVPPPELLTLTVTPSTATITIGGNVTFTASGTYEGSDEAVPVAALWEVSDEDVAEINSGGTATGLDTGTVTVRASSGGRTATATLTVNEVPTLTAITVTPAAATAAIGDSISYLATGTYTYSDGSTMTDEVDVTWSVANTTIASIDAVRGVALARSQGTTDVRAVNGGIIGTATITVTAPELREVIVTPTTASVPAGAVQTFQARGVYSDSPVPRVISGTVNWTVDDGSVASLSSTTGSDVNASGLAVGSATLTASSGGFSDDATLTVTAAELTGVLRVTPAVGRVIPGTSTTFTLVGSYTDGSEAPIDDANVNWASSDDSLATIDGNGTATGVAEGEVTVTATLADGYEPDASPRSATAELIIANEVCAIPLLGADNASVGSEVSPGCLLCSVDDEGNVIDGDDDTFATFTIPVGLLNADASLTVAAADNGAYALPFAAGTQPGFIVGHPEGSLLTAEILSQISITTLLNSTAVESSGDTTPLRLDLLGLNLIGDSEEELALISFDTTQEYNAIRLTFDSGLATALSSLNVYSACGATALPPEVKTLVEVVGVQPETPSVIVDASTELVLIGLYDDGSEGPIPDADVDWVSSDTDVASIDAGGVATGLSVGQTTITGTLKDGVADTAPVRSAATTLDVVPLEAACTNPFLETRGAVVEADIGGICLLCGTVDAENVIQEGAPGQPDIGEDGYATMFVPVALLDGEASITVSTAESNDYELPFPAGQRAGFIIAQPPGTLLSAELLSQIEISTLRNGIVQDSTSSSTTLAVDLLGETLLATEEQAVGLLTLETTQPFDALRFTFHSGVATALTSVQIGAACAEAAAP